MSVLLMWCQNIQIFGLSLNKGGCWELNRQSLSWLSIFCFYLELENDPDLHDATLSIDMTVPCWPVQWFFPYSRASSHFPLWEIFSLAYKEPEGLPEAQRFSLVSLGGLVVGWATGLFFLTMVTGKCHLGFKLKYLNILRQIQELLFP